ncbi:MAG: hypothetical protein K1X91_15925 [Bacteriodetes bacterium]|nr:hypothetical protein [Bacteroidota bacterium]
MSELSKIETIEFMLKQFKPERYAYLTVSIVSFLLLVVCVVMFILRVELTEKNFAYIAGMMGSGGTIAYSSSQLLRMWADCMAMLNQNNKGKSENE